MKRIPWWMARKLDRKFNEWCWAEMVYWVLGHSDLFDFRFTKQACDELAYCGKCEKNRRLKPPTINLNEYHK